MDTEMLQKRRIKSPDSIKIDIQNNTIITNQKHSKTINCWIHFDPASSSLLWHWPSAVEKARAEFRRSEPQFGTSE